MLIARNSHNNKPHIFCPSQKTAGIGHNTPARGLAHFPQRVASFQTPSQSPDVINVALVRTANGKPSSSMLSIWPRRIVAVSLSARHSTRNIDQSLLDMPKKLISLDSCWYCRPTSLRIYSFVAFLLCGYLGPRHPDISDTMVSRSSRFLYRSTNSCRYHRSTRSNSASSGVIHSNSTSIRSADDKVESRG